MLTSWKSLVCAVALGVVSSLTVRAETPEEIAQMAQKGLGEEVQMAAVDRTPGFSLNADQIIKLKEAGVSDKVIAAMMRKKAAPAVPAPATPAPLVIAPAVPAPAAPAQVAEAGQGTLNIENVDDRSWGYRLDAQNKTLWITPVDQNTQTVVTGHGGLSLAVPSGNYEIRYTGEGIGAVCTVAAGSKSLVLFSRVENSDFEGLYASVFENGERKGGGRLAVLRQGAKASPVFQQVPGATTAQVTQPQVQAQPVQPTPTYTYEQPQTQVVERYSEPSTTVIYRDPAPVVYTVPGPYYYPYSPYYYNGYPYRSYSPYYGSPYYNRPGVSIGIGGSTGHRGSGVRWGVGFGF